MPTAIYGHTRTNQKAVNPSALGDEFREVRIAKMIPLTTIALTSEYDACFDQIHAWVAVSPRGYGLPPLLPIDNPADNTRLGLAFSEADPTSNPQH